MQWNAPLQRRAHEAKTQRDANDLADLIAVAGDRSGRPHRCAALFPCTRSTGLIRRRQFERHLLRLARRNAEYARIEAPDIVQNPRGESVTLTPLLPPRVAEPLLRKALRWDLADCAPPFEQQ